jgi:hypothetical protein
MEAHSRRRDDGECRSHRRRAERALGPAQGEPAGTTLAAGKTDAASNALIKAVVADFETSEGRSLARDGLKERFAGSKPAEIKAKCLETLRQVGVLVDTKAREDAARSRGGCDRSASM